MSVSIPPSAKYASFSGQFGPWKADCIEHRSWIGFPVGGRELSRWVYRDGNWFDENGIRMTGLNWGIVRKVIEWKRQWPPHNQDGEQ